VVSRSQTGAPGVSVGMRAAPDCIGWFELAIGRAFGA